VVAGKVKETDGNKLIAEKGKRLEQLKKEIRSDFRGYEIIVISIQKE